MTFVDLKTVSTLPPVLKGGSSETKTKELNLPVRRVGSHDSDLLRSISSGLLSCRVLPEVSPLPAEVREDGEARAALRRLPSAAAGAGQPIAGALCPQVQEGQEELHLQVRSRVFFFQARPQLPTFPFPTWTSSTFFLGPPSPCCSSPCLCRADAVFTYFPCLSFAHLANCFPCASLQQGFQLSSAQQEMPLASLRPLQPRRPEAAQRQLHLVREKR